MLAKQEDQSSHLGPPGEVCSTSSNLHCHGKRVTDCRPTGMEASERERGRSEGISLVQRSMLGTFLRPQDWPRVSPAQEKDFCS